ncbi:MAG: alpha/beta hydrolase [Ginsengibacter sp.]
MSEIIVRNKKIFYRAEGKGKPVLLLHGFGEDGNIWNPQFKSLKEDHFVIVPDLPGSGQSEMLEGECTLDDYAEVVKAIVDKEVLENGNKSRKSFTLIGHSMGGYITLAFAKKYPETLNSFGLFHSSAFADDEQKIATRKKGIDFIKKNGTEAFMKASVPDLFSEKTKSEKPELVEELLTLANKISPEALVQYYEAMIKRPDTTSVLKSFSGPVLFIIGKHDALIPLQVSLEQCHIPAISSIHILQNSGHLGMWEQQQLSNIYLANFLNAFV